MSDSNQVALTLYVSLACIAAEFGRAPASWEMRGMWNLFGPKPE